MQQKTISAIRAFNRYYTNLIGLLDRRILNSSYSLPEARILYELSQREGIQASGIIESLGIDKGYLSRILDQFAAKQLIHRRRSQADGRLMHIYLTEKGKAAFKQLNQASDEQLKQLLGGLSGAEGEQLSQHMAAITNLLVKARNSGSSDLAATDTPNLAATGSPELAATDSPNLAATGSPELAITAGAPDRPASPGAAAADRSPTRAVSVRTDLRPGDLGYITHLHGRLYMEECNFGIGFEAYVAQGLAELYKQYDPEKDRMWICEEAGRIAGFLALMHRDEQTAQLRYFLLLPEYRGMGLGKQLMESFIGCLREKSYRHCYLWTTREQEAAIALYKRYGFVLTEEKASSTFGKQLYEQKYELSL